MAVLPIFGVTCWPEARACWNSWGAQEEVVNTPRAEEALAPPQDLFRYNEQLEEDETDEDGIAPLRLAPQQVRRASVNSREAEKGDVEGQGLFEVGPRPSDSASSENRSRTTEDRLKDLPMCPMVGCSYAFLKDFAEAEGKKLLDQAQDRRSIRKRGRGLDEKLKSWATKTGMWARKGHPLPEATPKMDKATSLDDESFNMGAVCNDIIKPRTKLHRGRSQFFEGADPKGGPDPPVVARQQSGTSAASSSRGQGDAVAARDSFCSASAKNYALSYAELGMQSATLDSRGKPAFAKATHFVSHAWKCPFRDFVEAIGFWLEQSSTDEDTAYFWVDAFVVNQHETQEYPQEWWSTRFMQAIGDIGNTVLVLEPWHHPVPLTRAWVIWELYCTTVCGAKLHLAMSKHTLEEFKGALLESFERVQTAMSRVDVSKSDAFHEHDRAMIHAEIQRTIGFTAMNEVVQTRMLQWLADYVKGQLRLFKVPVHRSAALLPDPEDAAPSLSDGTVAYTSQCRLKENLGRLLRESGRALEAEALLLELQTEVEDAFGRDHTISLSCLNQLAVTVQKLGKEEEALRLHRDCLERRMRVLGPGHADTLQSLSNLAVMLGGRKDMTVEQFNEARQLYAQAISGREASAGKDHPRTLYTVSNLGILLSAAPELTEELLEEAEQLHERAVSGLVAALHVAHPLTLTALHNQACHWLACAAFQRRAEGHGPRLLVEGVHREESSASDRKVLELKEKAYEQLRQVHNHRTEKLGKDHPDTVLTEHILASPQFDEVRVASPWGSHAPIDGRHSSPRESHASAPPGFCHFVANEPAPA